MFRRSGCSVGAHSGWQVKYHHTNGLPDPLNCNVSGDGLDVFRRRRSPTANMSRTPGDDLRDDARFNAHFDDVPLDRFTTKP